MEGIDWGLVGSSYTPANKFQDDQLTMNFYVEVSQNDKSKTKTTLLGCPGKLPIAQLGIVNGTSTFNGEVRGCWVLPGGITALYVVGNIVILATMTTPATSNSIAQFSYTNVGTLLTNSGQVSIKDNGAGGYAVIVDGQYGYYYRIAGASSFTFTGGTTSGTSTVTWPATVPSQLIVGSVITDSSGVIPAGSTITGISVNSGNLTISSTASSTVPTDTFTVQLAAFGQITDPNFLGADKVDFVDGWLLFNQPGTQNIYTNAPTAYTLIFQGAFYAKADVGSDNVITHIAHNREWWVIGERHTEVWYDAGGANFSFSRIPGVAPQIGCAAKNTIARLGGNIIWMAKSERGENIVVKSAQYSYEVVSNRALENAISQYPFVSDAFGFVYLQDGHLFYVLTFPTADATWVYDETTSVDLQVPTWHQRGSFDSGSGTFHRDRSNCYTNFQDLRIVGDYQSGQIHMLSRTVYTDAGNVLKSVRRAPHAWSNPNRKRLFFSALQIEFSPGVGLSVGQGVNPQVMLRQSNDSGQTFGTEKWTTVGAIGKTKNRAIWRKLGQARDTVFEVSITDPVNRDIVGATLFVKGEA
jgi:hypothetical protein